MRAVPLLLALILGATARAAAPGAAYRGADPHFLAQVRREFAAAPESAAATQRLLATLTNALPADPAAWPPVFQAYRGALVGLRGKHARLPWDKYARAQAGLALLDPLAAAHPESIEIRMLRFSACVQLPELFGRGAQIATDRAALVELFAGGADPAVAGDYRRDLVRWLLQTGRPTAAERRRLESVPGE